MVKRGGPNGGPSPMVVDHCLLALVSQRNNGKRVLFSHYFKL